MNDDFMEPKQTSVVGGIIGALLGAIIGAIPWAIVIYFGWFIGYLAFLIAFASFFGYKLLKGPKNKTVAMGTVIFCSILLIFVMNFVMIALWLYNEGYLVDVENILIYIELAGSSFIIDVVISLVIGIAGVLGIKKNIEAYINPQKNDSNQRQSDIE